MLLSRRGFDLRGRTVSPYARLMAATVQLLALAGLLYAALSLFQLLNAHLLAGAVPANLVAPIAMVSAGVFAAWLIGGAPALRIKRAIA